MKATNIKWDVDFDIIMETLEDMETSKVAKLLDVAETEWNTTSDRDILVENVIDNNYELIAKIMELPTEVEIPSYINEDDVSNFLSDKYEFCCHDGYELE